MKEQLTVIKVGGKILEDSTTLNALLTDFSAIAGPKVLVHGGGRSATALATELGIPTTMIDGRRVTDDAMLRVVTMVYAGAVNKGVVAGLQARGVDALGMTGADMDIIRSHRRPVTPAGADFGWVGDVDSVRGDALERLIREGVVPVIAPITHDGQGHLLNTNADTMAASVATGLASYYDVTLVYCFEKPGVMADPDDDNSVIAEITPDSYSRLRTDGVVNGGMIPKLDNAFDSLNRGVGRVIITRADAITNPEKGTTVKLK